MVARDSAQPLRTVVSFRADGFNVSVARAHFINPHSFGDDVLQWMIRALRDRKISTDEEPVQEDFGWYFNYEVDGVAHCFLSGYQPEEGNSPGVWIGEVERSRGLLGSIFRRRSVGVTRAAAEVIHDLLSSSPGISEVSWRPARDVDAEQTSGAATP